MQYGVSANGGVFSEAAGCAARELELAVCGRSLARLCARKNKFTTFAGRHSQRGRENSWRESSGSRSEIGMLSLLFFLFCLHEFFQTFFMMFLIRKSKNYLY